MEKYKVVQNVFYSHFLYLATVKKKLKNKFIMKAMNLYFKIK